MISHERLGKVIDEETERYRERTVASRRHYDKLAQFLPGGNSRTQLHFAPYPLVLEQGSGANVVDVDGNEYLDLVGNYGVLIFGHVPDFVVEAVRHQSSVGT